MVYAKDHSYKTKTPKSSAGYRTVQVPPPLAAYLDQLPRTDPRIVPTTSKSISESFINLRNRLGYSFRFHDLRHYYASMLLALGVPDKYAMRRMGHSTPSTLKRVYQHIMDDKDAAIDSDTDAAFTNILASS